MTCFWFFNGLALCSLPAVLVQAGIIPARFFPAWLIHASFIALIAWIAQTYFQLVLLPSIGVGQNLQNEAADARSAKTFEDVEALMKGQDHSSQILAALQELLQQNTDLTGQVHALVAGLAGEKGAGAAR
jgi:hypothetical protein